MSDTRFKQFLRTDDMLASLRISRTTLHRLVARGTIPRPIKLGNTCLWPEEVLETIG